MKKSLVITKSMADKLAKLPAATAGGVIKHLINYVYGDGESDSRYRMFEKMVDTCKKASTEECERIIAYLNSRLKTRYTLTDATRARIDARFAEGHTVEDFITVIDTKATEWLGSDAAKYLRPETLFGSKFEGYLNQKAVEGSAAGFAEGSFDTSEFFAASAARGEGNDITETDCPFLK